ncbi:PREDICTED: serine/threonine-protein phosphatase Pgam5, mitochondrial [Drosophila arizonae]|uniref:Serine/threonine-protein phosphatase PGAM5, mitochondrial n=1 Tax=Drosophila arizonae TaxID=7263 RepID=A0ABM1PP03_DROAR|nr:PREDICTED: serine/threonine-protein phosphatase Pgam5, mitochondrial [Drosophila arizonae]
MSIWILRNCVFQAMKFQNIWRSLGAVGGGSLATYVGLKLIERNQTHEAYHEKQEMVGRGGWCHDWDQRQLVQQKLSSESGIEHEQEPEAVALRHIVLVRHGEYKASPDGGHLTELGRLQAHRTGQRLHEMGVTWDHVVASTMSRAQETAMIILKQINFDPLKMKRCELLPEGTPCPADPPQNRSVESVERAFRRDGPRIEAAFRRYFFRASPEQKQDSYLLVIGHANVIRYLVCRALQFSPEAWTRFTLHHGSITWLTVWPTGYVTLRCLGDTGFMSINELTHRRPKEQAK